MSKLAEFRQLEKHLAEQLQALKDDAGLKREIEFETKLRALLAEYGYSLPIVIKLLDPQAGRRAPAVDSKAGTHKSLKEWKAEHGSATVESWLTK